MSVETLNDIVARLGWDHVDLARLANVDPKTAARWLSGECQPYRRMAYRLLQLLARFGMTVSYRRLRRLLEASKQVWQAGAAQRECSAAIATTTRLADAVERPCPVLARQAVTGADALTRLYERRRAVTIRRGGKTMIFVLPC
jgi:hypothetical protein